jgi:TolA-binding protein
MRLELYLVAAGIIGITLFRVHSHFNERYNGQHFYEQKVALMQNKIDQADLEKALVEKQQFDYQQSVAMQLPDLIKKDSYNARNIASVINAEPGKLAFDQVPEKLSQAKNFFNIGKFDEVETLLEEIYKNKPEHPLAPESVFLLMEAKHFLGKREEAADIIQNMVRLYPESYLTGYALLRLAEYFVQEGDEDRAKYLYKFIGEKFSYDEQLVKSSVINVKRLDDDTL